MSTRDAEAAQERWRDAEMVCRDGVRLVSRLWFPEGEGPWPVLLMRQPYGRAIASTVTYAHPSWYASQGFLVVVQDVRGRGDSQGEFGGFPQEAADGADAIRWARQLPSSNGRLGCYGFSYQGLTQLLSDSEEPLALPDCMAPAMAGLDEGRDWAQEGGAHWWALGLGWGLQLAAQRCQRLGDDAGWLAIRDSLNSGAFVHHGLELLTRHDPGGMALRWLQSCPNSDPSALVHQPSIALLRRPMLLIGGWHDPHLRGILDVWSQARAAGGTPMLRIGAWTHLDWRGGIDRLQLAFFQQHLHSATSEPAAHEGVAHEAVLLQDSLSGDWVSAGCQEPSPPWALASDGLAAIDAGEGSLRVGLPGRGSVTVVHDPWRPVPGRGGHLGLDAGPCNRSDLDRRADVACFTTAPLATCQTLAGRPQLQIHVTADQPSFDLCAALSVLNPGSEEVRQLCTGVGRFQQPVGQSRMVHLDLQPLLATLTAGQRLRLSLAASAWPQIAVNPGDGSLPRGPSGPRHRVISLRFDLAGAQLQLRPLLIEQVGAN